MSEIVTNEFGGKQSRVAARFDLIPAETLQQVALVLGRGAEKYGVDNWKLITVDEHLNHALNHVNLFMLNDNGGEDHLVHAIVRLMFAYYVDDYGVQIDASPSPRKDPTNQPSFEEAFSTTHNWEIE